MIRATRTGMFDVIRQNATRQMARLTTVQEQAVTGLLINRPSDAPEKLSEVHRLRAASLDQETWGQNAERAGSILSAMDGALANASDILLQAREIAVTMASETYNADDRASYATAVENLRSALLVTANTEFDGRYVFAGTAYDAPAFDTTGVYQGNASTSVIEVGPNQTVDVGLDGSAVFQSGVGVFQVLQDLQTALETNDTAAITTALANIDVAGDSVTQTRVALGIEAATAEDALGVTEGLMSVLATRMDTLVTADPVETYTALAELQGAYQTTLQVAAQVGTTSLFDLL